MKTELIYIKKDAAAKEENLGYILQCQDVRREVFVKGQGVSESVDFDGEDSRCAHLLLLYEDKPAGTLRIRESSEGIKLERIAVLEKHRGKDFGRALVKTALALVSGRVYLHAQTRSQGFYEKVGFVVEDPTIYYEDDIPHVTMIWPKGQGELPCTITTLS